LVVERSNLFVCVETGRIFPHQCRKVDNWKRRRLLILEKKLEEFGRDFLVLQVKMHYSFD
jgi:hypothetical protein